MDDDAQDALLSRVERMENDLTDLKFVTISRMVNEWFGGMNTLLREFRKLSDDLKVSAGAVPDGKSPDGKGWVAALNGLLSEFRTEAESLKASAAVAEAAAEGAAKAAEATAKAAEAAAKVAETSARAAEAAFKEAEAAAKEAEAAAKAAEAEAAAASERAIAEMEASAQKALAEKQSSRAQGEGRRRKKQPKSYLTYQRVMALQEEGVSLSEIADSVTIPYSSVHSYIRMSEEAVEKLRLKHESASNSEASDASPGPVTVLRRHEPDGALDFSVLGDGERSGDAVAAPGGQGEESYGTSREEFRTESQEESRTESQEESRTESQEESRTESQEESRTESQEESFFESRHEEGDGEAGGG
jgi:hypothetical protein